MCLDRLRVGIDYIFGGVGLGRRRWYRMEVWRGVRSLVCSPRGRVCVRAIDDMSDRTRLPQPRAFTSLSNRSCFL
jgi:hypothetical protein